MVTLLPRSETLPSTDFSTLFSYATGSLGWRYTKVPEVGWGCAAGHAMAQQGVLGREKHPLLSDSVLGCRASIQPHHSLSKAQVLRVGGRSGWVGGVCLGPLPSASPTGTKTEAPVRGKQRCSQPSPRDGSTFLAIVCPPREVPQDLFAGGMSQPCHWLNFSCAKRQPGPFPSSWLQVSSKKWHQHAGLWYALSGAWRDPQMSPVAKRGLCMGGRCLYG